MQCNLSSVLLSSKHPVSFAPSHLVFVYEPISHHAVISPQPLYYYYAVISPQVNQVRKAVLSREEKGRLIAENATQIMAMDESHFKVASQSRDICYDVVRRENGSWLCTCFDFYYRHLRCKHIIACQIREQLREKVRENIVIRPVEITACIYCQSIELKKFGIRHNKYGDIQRFLCVSCERTSA